MVGVVAFAALLVAGCGASSHPNKPRPQVPTRVSVTLNRRGITVTPARVAFGPERTQQIPQNQNHPQPPIKTDRPLDLVFVAANQTFTDTHLVIHGPKAAKSGMVFAHGPGTFQTTLPTGVYTITATEQPEAKPGKLVVGPYRASSENDVLLP